MSSLEQTIVAARAALARGDMMTARMAASELARGGGRSFDAQMILGEVLGRTGKNPEAHAAFTAAVKLRPMSVDARLKLGVVLLSMHRAPEAEVEFRRAVAIKPGDAEAWLSLAKSRHTQRRLDEAIDAGREAQNRATDQTPAELRQTIFQFLGGAYGDAGRMDESLDCVRAAADLPVFNPGAASNYLIALNYRAHDPVWLRDEHQRRMDAVLERLGPDAARLPAWANTPEPDRRLTVAILSPDLHNHVCMRFMLPVIEGLDRERFRLAAYAHVTRPDAITQHVKQRCDLWRDITGFNGPNAAELARRDGVDIMIECAGHTNNTRIDVMAWRAAPVQCTWLGYPNTTGMRTIDWRIVDAISDPVGTSEAHCTERLLRVDPCAWCYRPPEQMPEVGPSPAAASGGAAFTFGSFNNMAKVTPEVCAAWGAILARAPRARLILKDRWSNSPKSIGWAVDAIIAGGAKREQIEVLGFAPPSEFFATYNRVDLQLDPFPYNGTTTTCENLWLGVPVLTIEGDRHAARVGASLLSAAGLPEFIAPNIEGYIEKAAALANDPARLIELRPKMRDLIGASPLRDEKRYCEAFGETLRTAWREWCGRRTRT